MGFAKEERSSSKRLLRWFKTFFFVITMLVSLLIFSAPILVVVADAFLPSALLTAYLSSSSLSIRTLSSNLTNYDFRYSLIDIPLISLIRSAIILCVYSLCDGPKLSTGLYLSIATMFSVSSLLFVAFKASLFAFRNPISSDRCGYVGAIEVALMFACSLALAIGHIVVAYRTSCRERRKLLVYKIDVEAVSACKNGFPRNQKLLQVERVMK